MDRNAISLFEVWRAQKERACFSLGNELSRQKITQIEAPPLLLCPPYFKNSYASMNGPLLVTQVTKMCELGS